MKFPLCVLYSGAFAGWRHCWLNPELLRIIYWGKKHEWCALKACYWALQFNKLSLRLSCWMFLLNLRLLHNKWYVSLLFFVFFNATATCMVKTHTNTSLHNSVHSLSEKWPAMFWWPWTSLTTCLWRTWGSSEGPSCTRTATPSQSSSTTDVMETSACASWVWRTSQVSGWFIFLVTRMFHICLHCVLLWELWVS